jgi:WD40 repeat protein
MCLQVSTILVEHTVRPWPAAMPGRGRADGETSAAHAAAMSRPDAERVNGIRERLTTLFSHEAELNAELVRVTAKREQVRAEIKAAEGELDVAINTPVSGGRDPTEWLPDELMLMVLERVPFATLWSGVCERVCQRWERLMESALIVRRKHIDGRWAAFEAGRIQPQMLDSLTAAVAALAIAPDGMVYSGSGDGTVRVWSGETGVLLMTLRGHTNGVIAVAVGPEGKIYSGSYDTTVRVWSRERGANLQILDGHSAAVTALAVGINSKVYSGSQDRTVRVWSGDDGTHLQTLVGHTRAVKSLAVGKDGVIYSGSYDTTIRVWSGHDGTHLRTLVGHTDDVNALAVGRDGKVYSGSTDMTVRVWSPDDGTLLQTLEGHANDLWALAVGRDGKVFSGSSDGIVRVWSGESGALLYTLSTAAADDGSVHSLVVGPNGRLYSGHNTRIIMWT